MYTELELVNHILQIAGEDQTATLVTSHPAVIAARSALSSYNKEFQGTGWYFNRDFGMKLLPDVDGKVAVPDNALSFQVTSCLLQRSSPFEQARFVRRGSFVYDTVKHTNVINMAVWADLIVLLDYADLPPQAGTYLKHLAGERYFLDVDGDISQTRELSGRTARARAELVSEQLRVLGTNALNSPSARWLRHGVPQLNRR